MQLSIFTKSLSNINLSWRVYDHISHMQETEICVAHLRLRFIIMWHGGDTWLYYTMLSMVCQYVQISSKRSGYYKICIDETVSLNSTDKSVKNVILTEAGIVPQIQSSVDYMICTSHLNKILKQHLLLKKRNLSMLPSRISSHPDIDHSSCVELQWRPSNKKGRKQFQIFVLKWYICYTQTLWSSISNWNT